MCRRRAISIAVGVVVVAVALPAVASTNRAFVASNGLDANAALNCSLVAPCRSFAGALAVTNPGGEIVALDTAGYGAVTIDRSVSITGPDGVYAGITVSTGNGVTIATAGVDVVLRGLIINGVGGSNGILMTDGASLRVERCTVSGFTATATAGINIGSAAKVLISDTVVSRNNVGIVLDGGANVEISRVNAIANSAVGILMAGTSNATTSAVVTETRAFANGVCGFHTLGQSASTGGGFGSCASCTRIMTVSRSTASNNAISGFCQGGTGATVTVGSSVSARNGLNGMEQALGGTFRSAQDNVVVDNGTNPTAGTITTTGVRF